MPLTFVKAIESYLEYLKFQKRYSAHTILSYNTDLESFRIFMLEQFRHDSAENIKPAFVRSWLASSREEGKSPRTINRHISSLKSFFKYLIRKGEISVSPMATIISQKVNKRLPQYVEKNHMDTLIQHVEFSDGFEGQTERLAIIILYHTGIRQAELLSLKDSNIDNGNGVIKVFGKGGKERIIPVNRELLDLISGYIKVKCSLFEKSEKLLVNKTGKPLYPKYLYNVVKKYLSFVTTIDKRSPHVLRHTFATHLTGNGADLNAVKELLGHSSLAATQVYTHNSIERLKDIHSLAHPKS
jgi:integrase/recombinase XerC